MTLNINFSDPDTYCKQNLYLTTVTTDVPTRTKTIDLTNNSIQALDNDSFSRLTNVTTIDLRDNVIQTVDNNSFAGLTNLTNLVLRNNNISSLPACLFLGQKHLRYLDMSWNNLKIIYNDLWICLNSLETLSTTGNPVAKISLGAFAPLKKLTTIHIDLHILVTFNITILNPMTYSKATTAPKIVVEDVSSLPCNSSSCWLKKAEDKGLMGHYMFHGSVQTSVLQPSWRLLGRGGTQLFYRFVFVQNYVVNVAQMAISHLRSGAIWGGLMCKHPMQTFKCKIHGCKCCKSLEWPIIKFDEQFYQ